MIVPGTHPAAEGILGEDVYVEQLHPGPTVGFALVRKEPWIDMPLSAFNKIPMTDRFNPTYHYVGQLHYGRIILTDVMTETGPLDHEAKFVEADRIGMECVQLLYAGALESPQQIQDFLTQAPEGIVVKPIKASPQQRLVYVEITPEMFGPASAQGDDASCQTRSLAN
jgi:hypothetical protein